MVTHTGKGREKEKDYKALAICNACQAGGLWVLPTAIARSMKCFIYAQSKLSLVRGDLLLCASEQR
jgi:hypothetical protein